MNLSNRFDSKGKSGFASRNGRFNSKSIVSALIALAFATNPLAGLALERPVSQMHDGEVYDKAYYPKTKVKAEKREDGGLMLKGEIDYCVPAGTPIKLKLATVPTSGLRLLDRDLEGNLRPAQLGQEITAKTTEDIFIDSNKVIPMGTTFSGYVSKIVPPKRMARPGSLEIKFETLKLPDGRKFEFGVRADNIVKSTAKSKAKGVGRVVAYAGGGAAMGAIIAYKVSGLQTTISMHGYNIAAGAAVGAIAATTYAMMKKGRAAVLEPGDDLNMNIDADLLMPVSTNPTVKKAPKHIAGLEVEILKTKKVSDGLGGQLMRVDMNVDNNTKQTVKTIDFYLEDTQGNRTPVSLSQDDEDSELNVAVYPYSLEKIRLHFGMEYPKLQHKLIILDHNSRRVAHVVPLD
ncbi:MAG: hypothetical protein SGJ27_23000 [Candidatus Melainabacteria bacterium]|nr:hypothetical protein [Candidatus Melainabacteria bacterium]